MFRKTALAVLVLAALPMQAYAADGTARLDAHISTLGGGLEIGTALSESYTARVGFNKFSFNYNDTSGGQSFNGNLNWSSISALMDWRPWGGVTHLTAGAIFNSNKINASSTVANGSTYTSNGATFQCFGGAGCGVDFSMGFNKVAPYLGIGWSGQPKKQGFSFSTDIGIMFQGSPQATVNATGIWNETTTGTPVSATVSQVAAEAQTQLNSDLSNFKYYPVISVGIGYTF